MKEKICGIYKITSPKNKVYIGQSKDIAHRFKAYKGLQCKNQPAIYNSLKKHGWGKHKFEILHQCDEADLNKLEKYYVDLFNSFNSRDGMNLKDGGGNTKFSDETKERMRQKKLGTKASEETKAKMRAIRANMSVETRTKMSLSHKGKPNSEEHNKNIALAFKGRKITQEWRDKISKTLTGRKLPPFTEEHRKNMGKAQKGRKRTVNLSPEQRKVRSEIAKRTMTGRKRSEETKRKISEKAIARIKAKNEHKH